MNRSQARSESRGRVRLRIRQRVRGGTERPRLAIFKSGRHIYAQVIDDGSGSTLAHASSLDPGLRKDPKKAGVTKVVFDRGGYRYHGRVKALAEGARSGGLEF